MGAAVRLSTGTTHIQKLRFHDAGGAVQAVKHGFVRTAAGLKTFYASLAIALSKYSVAAKSMSGTGSQITTPTVTATVSGTIGTVTYAWTRISPDANPWTITAQASPTTAFSSSPDPGSPRTAQFICTITDSSGQTIASSPVSATVRDDYTTGGTL